MRLSYIDVFVGLKRLIFYLDRKETLIYQLFANVNSKDVEISNFWPKLWTDSKISFLKECFYQVLKKNNCPIKNVSKELFTPYFA